MVAVERLRLTETEARIVWALVCAERMPRARLMQMCFSGDARSDKALDVHIANVRRKLLFIDVALRCERAVGWYIDDADKGLLRALVAEPPAVPLLPHGACTAPSGRRAEREPEGATQSVLKITGSLVTQAERLRAKGWSVAGIARHLGVPADAVAAHFGVAGRVTL